MKKVMAVLAIVGLATAPTLAVVVTWSDFEVGTNHGLGEVGENLVAPAGYGPPSSYALDATIKTTNNTSQLYRVPGDAYNTNPSGQGWMIPSVPGSVAATDWTAYVQSLGGPAPDPNSPLKFIADVRIDVDSESDYNLIKTYILSNAPSPVIQEFDPLNNPNHNFGEWLTDFVLLETAFDNGGQLSFICILDNQFEINNPFAGEARFYMDNLRLEYIPEPASLGLLALGGLALLRRRR